MNDSLDRLRSDNRAGLGYVYGRLEEREVRGIALAYTDNAGISRTKAISARVLKGAIERGVGMSPVFDAFLYNDAITASEFSGGPIGDLRLFPDLRSLRVLEPARGWAWMAVDRYRQDMTEHPLCHRLYAKRQVERARSMGITSKMSFEIEWVVSKGDGDSPTAACSGPAYGLGRLAELGDYLLDVMTAVEDMGISVEQVHPEYAPGQFEISVEATDPVAAADHSVVIRHVIRLVSAAHGLRASFSPSVVAGGVGNGGHLHFSLDRDGSPLFAGGPGRGGLTAQGESALAGILAELPALTAIGSPSVPSYLRLVPQHWAGAFQCWGIENREASLRLVQEGPLVAASGANAEIKSFDLSASPYLVVGSVLGLALESVDRALSLPEPLQVDPASLGESELRVRGITRLPGSLDESLGYLSKSNALQRLLGPELSAAFSAVRMAELADLSTLPPEEVVARSRWVY